MQATGLPTLEEIRGKTAGDVPALLKQTVVLKLNGGLGTGMGLDKAKSLLKVKGENTFLDFIAQQVEHLRTTHGAQIKFMLMNSFSTSEDTLALLAERAPALRAEEGLELLQNKAPKVDAATLQPATWPKDPSQEWCPPGHGDLYAALANGTLDKLLAEGYLYMFVSNSDNLGATLDTDLLTYFAGGNAPFVMEVCERTESDKKGGHLCLKDGALLLRESAQCAKEDEAAFQVCFDGARAYACTPEVRHTSLNLISQDIGKHRYFNTNNLWVKLDALKQLIDSNNGAVPLPLIKNGKTVDPRDASSPKVWQLETAMGAAIECFKGASAVVVPRERFAPVKTCNDLLAVRSDAYKSRVCRKEASSRLCDVFVHDGVSAVRVRLVLDASCRHVNCHAPMSLQL